MEMQDSGGSLSACLAKLTSSRFTESFHFEEGEQWRTAPDVNFSHLMHLHTIAHTPNLHINRRRERQRQRNRACVFTWKQTVEMRMVLLRAAPTCRWGSLRRRTGRQRDQ